MYSIQQATLVKEGSHGSSDIPEQSIVVSIHSTYVIPLLRYAQALDINTAPKTSALQPATKLFIYHTPAVDHGHCKLRNLANMAYQQSTTNPAK